MPQINPTDPLDRIEQARRKINQLEAKGDEGRRAVKFVKDTFAETVDRMIDVPLMTGDPATLETFETNKERIAKLRSNTARNPNDDAERVISRLTNNGANLDQMANWLVGSTKTQPAARARTVADTLKTRLGEEDWAGTRQAVAAKLMQPRMKAGKQLSEQEGADDFMKFMHGRGEPLMTTLFSKKERDLMARIGNTVRLQGKQSAATVKPMLAQLGAMLVPEKPVSVISPLEFDKRFAGTEGPGMNQGYPVDDNARMQALIQRQHMIDTAAGFPNAAPLLGDLAAPFPVRP